MPCYAETVLDSNIKIGGITKVMLIAIVALVVPLKTCILLMK